MFKKIIRKNMYLYILSIISILLASLASTLFSLELGNIIDSINKDIRTLFIRILIATLYVFLNIIFALLAYYLFNKYVCKVLNTLKVSLFNKYYDSELDKYDDKTATNCLNLLTKESDLLLDNYLVPSLEIFGDIFSATMAITALLYISVKLAIIFTIISAINIVFSSFPGQYISKKTNIYNAKNKNYLGKITKYINGFEQIKLLNISNTFKNKFNEIDKDFEDNRFNYLFSKKVSRYFAICIALISHMLCFGIGVYFVIKGNVTVGMLLSSIQLLNSVFMPISSIGNYRNLMKSQQEIINNIDEILSEEKNKLKEINGNIQSISIGNLNLKFNDNIIFNNYSYKFMENKKYAILGKSGRGKSTLIKLIMKYFDKDTYTGNVYINNENINNIDSGSLYSKIAFIQKNDFLLDENIKNNIFLGRENKDISEIIDILNLKDIINKDSNNISMGEKQRIDIARFLINDYDVLIFDEPTSNLDEKTAERIEEYILNLKNKIIIVITHKNNKEFLDKFDEVINL